MQVLGRQVLGREEKKVGKEGRKRRQEKEVGKEGRKRRQEKKAEKEGRKRRQEKKVGKGGRKRRQKKKAEKEGRKRRQEKKVGKKEERKMKRQVNIQQNGYVGRKIMIMKAVYTSIVLYCIQSLTNHSLNSKLSTTVVTQTHYER